VIKLNFLNFIQIKKINFLLKYTEHFLFFKLMFGKLESVQTNTKIIKNSLRKNTKLELNYRKIIEIFNF